MDISFITTASAAWSVFTPDASYGAGDIIRVAVALVVLVSGLCAILFVIWWGLMLILSGGKDDKVKPAINSIRYAVIGIIIIVIAIFVAPKVSELLGLGTHDYLSPASIFDTIKSLMVKIFGTSSGASGSVTPDMKNFSDF